MDKKVWLSRRALKLHAVILIVVPGFLALCVWQIYRAVGGNSLSWAYVFEWPLFAGYAVYMWWRILHEVPDAPAPTPVVTAEANEPAPPAAPGETARQEKEDAELAAYNEYLAELAERDRTAGR
jgi:DNA-binding transcriptional regulator of glucitol operon